MAYQRFAFDTVFDGAGGSSRPAPAQVLFDWAEVEAARAEGFAEGEASANAAEQARAANALAALSAAAEAALPALAAAAREHKAGAAALALAAAERIAEAALALFPTAAAAAALEQLAREVEAAPRLVLRVALVDEAAMRGAAEAAAVAVGYPGALTVKADAGLSPAAFVYDWGDGRAAYDPAAAAARIGAALEAALAAEGLHGEAALAPTQHEDA